MLTVASKYRPAARLTSCLQLCCETFGVVASLEFSLHTHFENHASISASDTVDTLENLWKISCATGDRSIVTNCSAMN